jgi:hypothetical protein
MVKRRLILPLNYNGLRKQPEEHISRGIARLINDSYIMIEGIKDSYNSLMDKRDKKLSLIDKLLGDEYRNDKLVEEKLKHKIRISKYTSRITKSMKIIDDYAHALSLNTSTLSEDKAYRLIKDNIRDFCYRVENQDSFSEDYKNSQRALEMSVHIMHDYLKSIIER